MNATTQRQGMAVTSFILGLFSLLCLGLFGGIPAIVLGHIAHGRSRKSPELYGGGGLAMAGFILGYASILTTLILAGLMLPALAKAKSKAQSISCLNNMKQIGLALRVWSDSHQNQFPFNLSTNEPAGTLGAGESTALDSVDVFRAISVELVSPRILVCPADSSKRPAADFGTFDLMNLSYEIEADKETKPDDPNAVLVVCPIHGHELFGDGSVHQSFGR